MASLFGASWSCLLLAGLWSLLCGYVLRRAWTAEADEEGALRMASLRNESSRLRSDVEARNAQLQALKADLGIQRSRSSEVEGFLATKEAEMQALGSRLAEFEAKAAGFDFARLSALKTIDERDQAMAGMNARVRSLQGELDDAKARAEAARAASADAESAAATELARLRHAWDTERAKLLADHGAKLGLIEGARAESDQRNGAGITALLAKVAGLAVFETQARDLAASLDASKASLRAKDEGLATLKQQVQALEPLPSRIASVEADLAAAQRGMAERDSALNGLNAENARAAQTLALRDDELAKLKIRLATLEPLQAKVVQADTELSRLRGRIAELEPWKLKFSEAEAELARLRGRIAELHPLQEQLRNANANHEAALKLMDDKAARLDADVRARIGALQVERDDWQRRGESAQQQLAARDTETQALLRHLEALRNAPPRVVEKIIEIEKIVTVAAPMAAPTPTPVALAVPARSRDSGASWRDDLKVIEGIGPKIEMLLNNAGYLTFRSVADADPVALTAILETAGPRFKLARTDTWPEQAKLLASNDMEAFKTLTDLLKGGVRR